MAAEHHPGLIGVAGARALIAVSIPLLLLGLLAGYLVGAGTAATTTVFTTLVSERETTTTLTVTGAHSGSTVSSLITTMLTVTETVTQLRTTTLKEHATVTVEKIVEGGEVEAVCFPKAMGGCADLLIDLISRANESIYVMIYSFTLDELADALIDASLRGVEVKVLVEKENAYQRGSEIPRLIEAGVQVALDSNPALMHNKVMIVDGKLVVTGSYNWSWSAENRNDENLVVISGPEAAKLYEAEFERLWSGAEKP